METIATCARRFQARGIAHAIHVPNYSCPQIYPQQMSLLYPYIEFSKFRKLNQTLTDGLTEVHIHLNERIVLMPTKQRKNQNSRDGMPEMISSKLTDEELLGFDQWLTKKGKDFDAMIFDTLMDDHKIGISWDAYNDCFIASFTAKGDDHLNAGKCLMSRSNDWREAIAMNMFKCAVIYADDKGRWTNRNADKQRG